MGRALIRVSHNNKRFNNLIILAPFFTYDIISITF